MYKYKMGLMVKIAEVHYHGLWEAYVAENWQKKEYLVSLVSACTIVEQILNSKLREKIDSFDNKDLEKRINHWSPGRYNDWCKDLGIISKEDFECIKSLVEFRNKYIHDFEEMALFQKGSASKEEYEKIKGTLDGIKKFVWDAKMIRIK